jgi:hypothetical protein
MRRIKMKRRKTRKYKIVKKEICEVQANNLRV